MMSDAPAVEAGFRAWANSRDAFNADPQRGPRAWQRHYYLGKQVTGERAANHHTRLALARFTGAPEVEIAASEPGVEEPLRPDSLPRRVAGFAVAEVEDGFDVTDPQAASTGSTTARCSSSSAAAATSRQPR